MWKHVIWSFLLIEYKQKENINKNPLNYLKQNKNKDIIFPISDSMHTSQYLPFSFNFYSQSID